MTVCVSGLAFAEAVDDLPDRIELEVCVLLAKLLDCFVSGNSALSHGAKLLTDVVIPDRLLTQQIVLIEEGIDLIADQSLEGVLLLQRGHHGTSLRFF